MIKGIYLFNISINEYFYNKKLSYEAIYIFYYMKLHKFIFNYLDLFKILSNEHNILSFKAKLLPK